MSAPNGSAPKRKRAKAKPAEPVFRGRVVSVFGPFNTRALIEVSSEVAMELFGADLSEHRGFGVIDAVDAELGELRQRAPALAESAIAAAARALAYELEHPFNSLTSKSMATKELRESMGKLRDLAPPQRERNALDEIAERRAQRLAGGAAT